ncbi:histidine phosphatase family protein [Pseudorhodobacter sp.]|uniref:histidine phosphatase family protein n=1 Tax=Pseudorhodobacter sp. TaxID=1934400 RepID=UPI002B00367C|nr:histidine phosphatase family protein [Pseudorhodobacter sp.]
MSDKMTAELILIRHAPALSEGRIAGRRDVAADCSDTKAFAALHQAIGPVDHILVSPARRCQQTLAHLWPEANAEMDARLCEQDFGDWEGQHYDKLPDLGALDLPELAQYRPPNGESFLDLAARCTPMILEAAGRNGRTALIVHAGVIRATLGLALDALPMGLAFQVAPMSMTTILALPKAAWSIAGVNLVPR